MTNEETEEKIINMAEKIAANFDPEKIILFGSQAWGVPNKNSDIDLVVIKETNNTRRLGQEIDASLFPRAMPLDIVVCRPQQVEIDYNEGDFFMRAVIDHGKVLYERDY